MGDRQLHLREVAVEQIHVVPGDDLLVDARFLNTFAAATTALSMRG